MLPYTYLIGWSEHQKYYYGVRYAADCHPSDLWSVYYTSSDYVKNFFQEFGTPDIIQVRKTFVTDKEAIDWEDRVIRRIKAVQDDRWLNRSSSRAIHPEDALRGAKKSKNNHPWDPDDPRKAKWSEYAIANSIHERLNSPEAIVKSRETRAKNRSKLTPEERKMRTAAMNTPEAREKRKQKVRAKIESLTPEQQKARQQKFSEAAKQGNLNSAYDPASDTARSRKISEFKKRHNPGFAIQTCPYCGKQGQLAAMRRWHFEHCKSAQPA